MWVGPITQRSLSLIKTLAFIDESGNTYLDTSKVDVSKYFIVCAVIIDGEKFDSLRDEVETIREKTLPNRRDQIK